MYYAAQDIIEYLMASTGGGAQDSEHRILRSAAHHAYRDLCNARDWMWHVAEMPLPAADTGTNGRVFTLPDNVRSVDALTGFQTSPITVYITPQEWRRLENRSTGSGGPIFWTVLRAPNSGDRFQLRLANPLPQAPAGKTYAITYRRRPRPLRYMGYESACRNGSLTATNAPGAVKRYGTATHHPEGMTGIHPYAAEELLGVSGSLLGTPPENAKTVVSDYLDVSPNMYTALLSASEAWLARLQGKNVDGAMAVYLKDLRLAMEQDVIAPISGRRSAVDRYPEMQSPDYWGSPRTLGYYNPSAPDTGA
jgi:hypothetical protein